MDEKRELFWKLLNSDNEDDWRIAIQILKVNNHKWRYTIEQIFEPKVTISNLNISGIILKNIPINLYKLIFPRKYIWVSEGDINYRILEGNLKDIPYNGRSRKNKNEIYEK